MPEVPSHIWWSMGIDPNHPGNWALMSTIAAEILDELGERE